MRRPSSSHGLAPRGRLLPLLVVLLVLLQGLLLLRARGAAALCGFNFHASCTATLGNAVDASGPASADDDDDNRLDGSNTVTLKDGQKFYFCVGELDQVDGVLPLTHALQVSASLVYGSVDMYVTLAADGHSEPRKPKPADCDYSTEQGGQQYPDMVRIPTDANLNRKGFCVLVVGRAETEAVLLAATPAAPVDMSSFSSTVPVRVAIDESASSSSGSLDVVEFRYVIPMGELQPEFVVTASPIAGPGDPDLYVTNTVTDETVWAETPGADFVTIVNTAPRNDVDTVYKIFVTANDTAELAVSVSRNSEIAHPLVLLGGMPEDGHVDIAQNRYYILRVPAGEEEITISLSTAFGDADLFVNPASEGFFQFDGGPAYWSSEHVSGMEVINIPATDDSFLHSGGDYYITVNGFHESEYSLVAFSANTVVTLREGTPWQDSVSAGTYHYFRFYDHDPDKAVDWDVMPLSGDPDLYIGCSINTTGDDRGLPSRTPGHHNFSSARMSEDTLEIAAHDPRGCGGHIFYAAVYGFRASQFSLTAAHTGGLVTLHDGLPFTGTVFKGLGKMFRFSVGPQAVGVRVQLTVEYGDADLYAAKGYQPTRYHYDERSIKANLDADSVTFEETSMCSNCWIYIFVYGFHTSGFTVSATFDDSTVALRDAYAQKDAVADGSTQYFVYTPATTSDVAVTLTGLSGVAALAGSTTVQRPNATHIASGVSISLAAINGGVPFLVFDRVEAGSNVYIGVTGWTSNATFTIEAHVLHEQVDDDNDNVEEQDVPLVQLHHGTPQAAVIREQGLYSYFQMDVEPGHDDIRITAAPIQGNIDMYVTRCEYQSRLCATEETLPSTSHSTWSSDTALRDEVVRVNRTDQSAVSYIVAVYHPVSSTSSARAQFLLSAVLERTVLTLQEGVPVTDSVLSNGVSYFRASVAAPLSELSISVTAMSGDPDVYVSTATHYPNASHYMWRSRSFGSDTVTIAPDDENACSDCWYYISVVGYRAALYTIMSFTNTNGAIYLRDGVQQHGNVAYQHYVQYLFYDEYRGSRDLTVTLQPTCTMLCDADLYATVDGTEPSRHNYQFRSNSWLATSDVIHIDHDDSAFSENCLDASCSVRIAVYGFTSASYSISIASAMSTTLLQPNQAFSTQVTSDAPGYFRFLAAIPETSDDVQFTLTTFSGDPILYVSCAAGNDDHIEPPTNAGAATWVLDPAAGTSGVLTISADEQIAADCVAPATYALHVAAQSEMATLTVLASQVVPGVGAPELLDGMAQTGHVNHPELMYYVFFPAEFASTGSSSESPLNLDVDLTLTVLSGDADLYVSYAYADRPRYNTSLGVVTDYAHRSNSVFGNEHIQLQGHELRDGCVAAGFAEDDTGCYITIAVYGFYNGNGAGSDFSLVATAHQSITMLHSGVAVRGDVALHAYRYYSYSVLRPDLDVILTLTPFGGDPDLYVDVGANNKYPTRAHHNWSMATWGDDQLTLQSADMQEHCTPDPVHGRGCQYYIGVYGYTNSSFSITAASFEGWDAPFTLLDGQPVSGHVPEGVFVYYKFNVAMDAPQEIVITLDTTDGGDADLYVTFSHDKQPGPEHYDYSSDSWGQDEVVVRPGMNPYCQHCTIYMAVHGFHDSHYEIVASTQLISLRKGTAITGHVSKHKYRYYHFHNDLPDAELRVQLTSLTGDPDLVIGTSKAPPTDDPDVPSAGGVPLPTMNSYSWRSAHVGDDVLVLEPSHTHYCYDCDYFVGVYGWRNSSYTVLYTSHVADVVTLAHGRPQVGSVESGKLKYYRVTLGTSQDDVSISLTCFTGSADLYVTSKVHQNTNANLPTPSNTSTYEWTTAGAVRDVLHLPGPHPEQTVFTIGVYGLEETEFSIVASVSQTPVQLQEGVPQAQFVARYATEYFWFNLDEEADVQISVTSLSGDPDLFVSTTHRYPHCYREDGSYFLHCANYTWSSTAVHTDQMVLAHDLPCRPLTPTTRVNRAQCDENSLGIGNVYIGVFGFTDAYFNIMASKRGQHLSLVAGHPQLSITSAGYICASRTDSGSCDTADDDRDNGRGLGLEMVQTSYFLFKVSPDDLDAASHVMIFVRPTCNSSLANTGDDDNDAGHAGCTPGCDCHPLSVYVRTCAASLCTEDDHYPSYLAGGSETSMEVQPTGATLFISKSARGTDPAFCDPADLGEACHYYISVLHRGNVSTPSAFTITAATPGDVTLVPCDASMRPDGVRISAQDAITSDHVRHYELCVAGSSSSSSSSSSSGSNDGRRLRLDVHAAPPQQAHRQHEQHRQLLLPAPTSYADFDLKYAKDVADARYVDEQDVGAPMGVGTLASTSADETILRLEVCSGHASMYVCDTSCTDVFPDKSNFLYSADMVSTCTQQTRHGKVSTECEELPMRGYPEIHLPVAGTDTDGDSASAIGANNYFLTMAGDASVKFRVQTTVNGKDMAPKVAFDDTWLRVSAKGTELSVEFPFAAVEFPDLSSAVTTAFMRYSVYAFEQDTLSNTNGAALHTPCGLDFLSKDIASHSVWASQEGGEDSTISMTLEGLKSHTEYSVYVVAACDEECLAQLSRTKADHSSVTCNRGAGCVSESTVLSTNAVEKTGSGSGGGDEGSSGTSPAFVTTVVVLTIGSVGLAGIVGYAYLQYKKSSAADQYEVVDIQGLMGSGGSGSSSGTGSSGVGSAPKRSLFVRNPRAYRPLLADEDESGIALPQTNDFDDEVQLDFGIQQQPESGNGGAVELASSREASI